MVSIQEKLVLWTGERHCGKTTGVAKLAQKVRNEGFNICGVLAPCVYHNGKLVGFDVLDLQSNNRAPLARPVRNSMMRKMTQKGNISNGARRKVDKSKAGPFNFIADGFKLGDAALSTEAVKSADLVIVDEFGPLELKGGGWRKSVDSLLISSKALILLVVRWELVDAVKQLYKKFPQRELVANRQDSTDDVITILKNRCGYVKEQNSA